MKLLSLLLALAPWLLLQDAPLPTTTSSEASMKKITPILVVESVEAELPFWAERLGFEKTVEVPEGEHLGFVILQHGSTEVMLQSRVSVEKDDARLAAELGESSGCLFIEVGDLDSIVSALGDAPIVVARRKTFYGADEVFVRSPGGHVIGFAQFD